MPVNSPFSYAVYRLVPRVERGERINVGVVVFCRPLEFLEVRTALDEARALTLWLLFRDTPRPRFDCLALRDGTLG